MDFPVASDAVTIGADIDAVVAVFLDDVARCQGITVQTIFRKDSLALQYSLRLDILGISESIAAKHYAKWNQARQDRIGALMRVMHSGTNRAQKKSWL